jgi:enoyl-CoA hydratase/carnithine racemase
VIVTGHDGQFSAGYDLGGLGKEATPDEAESLVAHPFAAALDALEAYPYPTVAALTGHTIGGGLELALACDLRVAAGDIALGMPPARLGLVYSHTGLRKFLQTIGPARTRELFLTAKRIDARTAQKWGLVNDVAADVPAAALELANQIAALAPLAQRGNKRVIAALLEADHHLDPDVERELIELRRACFASEDFREAVSAFAAKRPPQWHGR